MNNIEQEIHLFKEQFLSNLEGFAFVKGYTMAQAYNVYRHYLTRVHYLTKCAKPEIDPLHSRLIVEQVLSTYMKKVVAGGRRTTNEEIEISSCRQMAMFYGEVLGIIGGMNRCQKCMFRRAFGELCARCAQIPVGPGYTGVVFEHFRSMVYNEAMRGFLNAGNEFRIDDFLDALNFWSEETLNRENEMRRSGSASPGHIRNRQREKGTHEIVLPTLAGPMFVPAWHHFHEPYLFRKGPVPISMVTEIQTVKRSGRYGQATVFLCHGINGRDKGSLYRFIHQQRKPNSNRISVGQIRRWYEENGVNPETANKLVGAGNKYMLLEGAHVHLWDDVRHPSPPIPEGFPKEPWKQDILWLSRTGHTAINAVRNH